jgi:hypothetical protein
MSEKWSQLGAKLWDEAQPGPSTLAEVYLNGRGIRLASWPTALRFHPAAHHPKLKLRFPAMIAKVIGGAEPSFQITYLTTDGRKAEIDKEDQRRTLGSNKGGVVLLTDDIQPGATLLVGEGVESVASAMQASGRPGVAVLGVGGLANVEFSPDVAEIVLLGENDDASRKAIDKVCPSLIEKGLKVRVAWPPGGFGDINDLIDSNKEGGGPGGLPIIKMIIDAAPEWKPKRGAKPKGEKAEKNPQSSFLVELAEARCELFTDAQGETYASFAVARGGETHRETHKVRSKSYGRWLRLRYYEERRGSPSSEAMATAIRTIESQADYGGVKHEVFLRVANLGNRVYIDTCNDRWEAIEIGADGWRIIEDPPVISAARRECCRCPCRRRSIRRKAWHASRKCCVCATSAISSSSSPGRSLRSPDGRPIRSLFLLESRARQKRAPLS